jgi:AcrR family transcriptional regulator
MTEPVSETSTSPSYASVSQCQACTLGAVAIEKLTPERRRQQTRDVLIAAATAVFARRGFEGASLEEIAETAGFTRGAIYKNFDGKEALFFAVTDLLNEQVIEAFRSIAPDSASQSEWDVSRLADLWRASVDEFEDLFAIGKEYELYVLRNPDARPRAVAHRRKQRDLVAAFIDEVAERSGMTLRLPASTLASIILAAADGLTYAARIDGDELFAPFLELLNAGMIAE